MKHLLLTAGDPKGIGPAIIAKSWSKINSKVRSTIQIYGDEGALKKVFLKAKIEYPRSNIIVTSNFRTIDERSAAEASAHALNGVIRRARLNDARAIVTAPVNKNRLSSIWPTFMGQTEWLKNKIGGESVMMFCPPKWKSKDFPIVFLVSTHEELGSVPDSINTRKIFLVINQAIKHLNSRKIKKPKIAVLGLNPHAGEGRRLGVEDETIIKPAIDTASGRGQSVCGPFPADAFFAGMHEEYHGVIAMYHDQGLIPAKMSWRKKAVNVTLGLPIIRTSPGHGTAEDLKYDQIDPVGMISAIDVAVELS